jgi:ABC-type nitrate/sulfonate/bicarbonate transport system permease component
MSGVPPSSTISMDRKSVMRRRLQSIIIIIASLTVFVIIWWALSLYFDLQYFPPPNDVIRAFFDSFVTPDPNLGITMGQNIEASFARFIEGFALAFVIAIPMGLLMGFMPRVEIFAKPIVELIRPIPPIAWVPFFFVAFGSFWNPVLTVFIGVFFPLLTNVVLGVKSVEPALLDAARTQGAGRFVLFTKVILPFSVPYLMTGVTIGMGVGWMCIVAAEWIAAVGGGVGYYILVQQQVGNYTYMFAGMIVIAILGLLTVSLSGYAEKTIRKRMGML